MKHLDEPTYKRYILSPPEPFDQRRCGFSRGLMEGDRLGEMHTRGIDNLARQSAGKSIVDHAMQMAGRTVDSILRKTTLARDGHRGYGDRRQLVTADPGQTSRAVKNAARWLGADLVGIAKLNRTWVYSHWGAHSSRCTGAASPGDPVTLPRGFDYAVVLIHEMAHEGIRRSPAIEFETDLAYSRSAFTAASLATFIRELGYRAIPAGNEIALSIPLAVDAGLGELGRMGLLITRQFGPRVRISKVLTDLVLQPDRPIDIGIQRFCERCRVCARFCPARALCEGDRRDTGWDHSNASGLLKWPVRAMKCLEWWVANGTHCSVCIRVCPWNKPPTVLHRGIRLLAERALLVRFLVRMDGIFGYGRQDLRRWTLRRKRP